jgi:hypothetical protein
MRKPRNLRALVAISIAVVTLSSLTLPAQAATGSSKSLNSAQARKMYEQVAKSTVKWVSSNPHEWSKRWSTGDEWVDRTTVVVDRDGDFRLTDNSETTYLIGETLYSSFKREDLADYEYEIAVDLGLAVDAKYATISPSLLDPEFNYDGYRQNFMGQELPSWAELTGIDAKPTKISYRKNGKVETLSITSGKKTASGGSLFTANVQIERGRVSSLKFDRTSSSDEYHSTITWKPFAGNIVAPSGPYLDWNKVYEDPRYRTSSEQAVARATLNQMYREAMAIAAFDGRDVLNADDWAEAASTSADVVMFDRGFEFSIFPDVDRAVKVCAVYTENGARAEVRTCSELGFSPLAS